MKFPIAAILAGVALLSLSVGMATTQPAPAAGARPAGPPGPRGPSPYDTAKASEATAVAAGVRVVHVKVHGRSLEGNLEGNAVDRDVIVLLPPSYAKAKARRYPTLYFMHGFALSAQRFMDFMHAPEALATSSKAGAEFIIVLPDADSRENGSMYSNSPTTGDFESFIAKDVVSYVDAHYRTLTRRSSRGLVGHSMGGYGVWKIAMKHPEPWGAIYAMSACCVSPRTETAEQAKPLTEIKVEDFPKANFGAKAGLASAAAWAPNPNNPPYYFDFAYHDGAVDPLVIAKFAANSPLVMVDQYVPALKSFNAIAADVGDKDFLLKDDTAIHNELDRFGIKHQFQVYDGDHVNRITARFPTLILPWFAQHLQMR